MDAATWRIVFPSLHHGILYSAYASLPPSAVINFFYAGALLIWIVVTSPAIVSQQISSRLMCIGLVSCQEDADGALRRGKMDHVYIVARAGLTNLASESAPAVPRPSHRFSAQARTRAAHKSLQAFARRTIDRPTLPCLIHISSGTGFCSRCSRTLVTSLVQIHASYHSD